VVDANAILGNRIKAIEQQNATKAANVEESLSQHFRVAVSCPPDTLIHVRGGNVFEGQYWLGVGYGYYIPDFSVDFSDPAGIDNYTGNFTNAGYYIGIIAGRGFYGEDRYVIGGGVEYATASEAEAYIEDVALVSGPWMGYDDNGGLPLCGIVLRNDGRVGVDGAVLPIDRVNRSRSYYWKDLRPRHYTMYII
jgi:hypothetical protein